MESESADAVRLSPRDEEEWERLRTQFHFAEGYWLGFLFSPSSYEARVFRQRVARVVEERGGSLDVFVPDSPEALRGVLPWLLSPERKEAACVWVEGFFVDLTGKEAAPWIAAWDEVMLRANERREALRRHLKGGLVFAAPVALKARFREAAPDVWSIRSIVVEMVGGVYPPYPVTEMVRAMVTLPWAKEEGETAPDPEFWQTEAERHSPGTSDKARALVQAARGLRRAGRLDEALTRISEAAEIYRDLSRTGLDALRSDLAACLVEMGMLQGHFGQLGPALHSMREATEIYRLLEETHPDAFSMSLADSRILAGTVEVELLLNADKVQEALALALQVRDDVEALGDAHPVAAFERAFAWYNVGRTLNRASRPGEALGALLEARQRFAAVAAAGNPAAAQLETRAIVEQGFALLHLGEIEEASSAYEEAIRRDEAYGNADEIAAKYVQLAVARVFQGHFENAIELCYGALLRYASIGDLARQATLWQLIGIAHARQGQFDEAEIAVQRSVDIARSVGNVAAVDQSLKILAEVAQLRNGPPPT